LAASEVVHAAAHTADVDAAADSVADSAADTVDVEAPPDEALAAVAAVDEDDLVDFERLVAAAVDVEVLAAAVAVAAAVEVVVGYQIAAAAQACYRGPALADVCQHQKEIYRYHCLGPIARRFHYPSLVASDLHPIYSIENLAAF